MESILLCVGKTDNKALKDLIQTYQKRLGHYTKFSLQSIDDIKNSKNLSEAEQKLREGKALQKHLKPADRIILLDEGGKTFTSVAFAEWINKQQLSGVKRLSLLLVGLTVSLLNFTNRYTKISLSSMTFFHQMVRLFFVEQLYRAHTI